MSQPHRPWKVLAEKNFGLFWVSLLVSSIGNQLSHVAIGWQIYELTSSPLHLGLTGVFRALPVVVFSLSGGVLADRVDRRRVLIFTQAVATLLALLLAVLTHTGSVQVWHIYAITFLTGAASTFDLPARMALIPSLVAREQLSNAFALNVTLRQTATLIGPFCAGVLIAWLGLSGSYFVNAASYLGVIACLIAMRVHASEAPAKKESSWQAMKGGLSFVGGHSVILGLLVMDTCVNVFSAHRLMAPVFARDILNVGPQGLGALLGAPAIGALLGSSIIIAMGTPKKSGQLLLWVTAIYGLLLCAFALSRNFALSLAICFFIGALDSVGETLRVTLIQLITPDEMRGRVQSLVHIFVFGFPLLGQGPMGALGSAMGAAGAVLVGGLLSVAVVAGAAFKVPAIRRFDPGNGTSK